MKVRMCHIVSDLLSIFFSIHYFLSTKTKSSDTYYYKCSLIYKIGVLLNYILKCCFMLSLEFAKNSISYMKVKPISLHYLN